MATLIITQTCENCGMHTGNIPLNCFDEATGAVLSILAEMAEIHEIVQLTRTWIEQEGKELATLDFADYYGRETFLTFTA